MVAAITESRRDATAFSRGNSVRRSKRAVRLAWLISLGLHASFLGALAWLTMSPAPAAPYTVDRFRTQFPVDFLAYSSDGSILYAGGGNGILQQMTGLPAQQRFAALVEGHNTLRHIAKAADVELVVAAYTEANGFDQLVEYSGGEIRTRTMPMQVVKLAVSRAGERIAAAEIDGAISVYESEEFGNPTAGSRVVALPNSARQVVCLEFLGAATELVTVTRDGVVTTYREDDNGWQKAGAFSLAGSVGIVACDPKRRQIANCTADQTLEIYDVSSGVMASRCTLAFHPICAAFSREGDLLGIGGLDGGLATVRVVKASNGRELARHELTLRAVEVLSFIPGAQSIAAANSGGEIQVTPISYSR